MGRGSRRETDEVRGWRAVARGKSLVLALLGGLALAGDAAALGPGTGIEVRRVQTSAEELASRAKAAERLAWEIRKRTSIETVLESSSVRFDDPSIFRTPLLYWSSDRGFSPLSERELVGLRRFVEYGGLVIVDDASSEPGDFEASVRRELARAFPAEQLERVPATHTLFRSFYLLERSESLEVLMHAARAAVIFAHDDLGSLWLGDERAESAFGQREVGSELRERAVRLGVNIVMYALCLDYKDDQVHAPFILRRRAGRP